MSLAPWTVINGGMFLRTYVIGLSSVASAVRLGVLAGSHWTAHEVFFTSQSSAFDGP